MIFQKAHPRSKSGKARSAAIEMPVSALEAHIRRKIEASDDLAPAQKKRLLAPPPITKLRKTTQ